MSSVFDTEYELSKIILAPDKVEQRKKVSPMKSRNNKNQTQPEIGASPSIATMKRSPFSKTN